MIETSLIKDEILASYLTCMFWAENDDNDDPLENNYTIWDLAPETLATCRKDCAKFAEFAGDMVNEISDNKAGHDFWLTRNGHGAGFWDGDWPENGGKLTELSHHFGEVWPYVGDDGLIYLRADLSGADLRGAFLTGADLRG